jgi:hypothetical protein
MRLGRKSGLQLHQIAGIIFHAPEHYRLGLRESSKYPSQVDFNALAGELEQLRKHLMQGASSSSDFRQLGLLAEAEEHAKKHEGSKTMEILSKLGKGLLGVANEISTDVAAKVIAKSMGLEP